MPKSVQVLKEYTAKIKVLSFSKRAFSFSNRVFSVSLMDFDSYIALCSPATHADLVGKCVHVLGCRFSMTYYTIITDSIHFAYIVQLSIHFACTCIYCTIITDSIHFACINCTIITDSVHFECINYTIIVACCVCPTDGYMREVVNFDVDLMDCTALACVLSAYCPFLVGSL